jgi:protein pelota
MLFTDSLKLVVAVLSLDLNQLTGVAAILNFPLPDIDDEEEQEPEEEVEEEPMHSNKNHEILDAVLG